jgi:hypothetical protein
MVCCQNKIVNTLHKGDDGCGDDDDDVLIHKQRVKHMALMTVVAVHPSHGSAHHHVLFKHRGQTTAWFLIPFPPM